MTVPLAKDIVTPLWVTASASATDAGVEKIHASGMTTDNLKWRDEWHNEDC